MHAKQYDADEVTEYLSEMAEKYELPVELVRLQWKLLSVRLHSEQEYKSHLAETLVELKNRDPEDAHVLALAKLQGLPIWSNDRDLAWPKSLLNASQLQGSYAFPRIHPTRKSVPSDATPET